MIRFVTSGRRLSGNVNRESCLARGFSFRKNGVEIWISKNISLLKQVKYKWYTDIRKTGCLTLFQKNEACTFCWRYYSICLVSRQLIKYYSCMQELSTVVLFHVKTPVKHQLTVQMHAHVPTEVCLKHHRQANKYQYQHMKTGSKQVLQAWCTFICIFNRSFGKIIHLKIILKACLLHNEHYI